MKRQQIGTGHDSDLDDAERRLIRGLGFALALAAMFWSGVLILVAPYHAIELVRWLLT